MSVKLYQGEHCPCPSDCKRHGSCDVCIEFHHQRGEQTYCEFLEAKLDDSLRPPELPVTSGRQVRLMDYSLCAG